jgi:hypothetical protein
MDPREAILAELGLSERIVRGGYEVVPRFSIHAPDGPHSVMIQLSHDLAERIKRMQIVRSFMIWKAADGFILASELVDPDAISVVAVTRVDAIGVLQRIHRSPLRFDPPDASSDDKDLCTAATFCGIVREPRGSVSDSACRSSRPNAWPFGAFLRTFRPYSDVARISPETARLSHAQLSREARKRHPRFRGDFRDQAERG